MMLLYIDLKKLDSKLSSSSKPCENLRLLENPVLGVKDRMFLSMQRIMWRKLRTFLTSSRLGGRAITLRLCNGNGCGGRQPDSCADLIMAVARI